MNSDLKTFITEQGSTSKDLKHFTTEPEASGGKTSNFTLIGWTDTNSLSPSGLEKFIRKAKARNFSQENWMFPGPLVRHYFVEESTIDHEWYLTSKDKLQSFEKLEEGWDSYSGKKIDSNVIYQSNDFLSLIKDISFESPPFLAPVSNGGINFEWDNDVQYLCIRLRSAGIDFSFINQDNPEENVDRTISSLNELNENIAIYLSHFSNNND